MHIASKTSERRRRLMLALLRSSYMLCCATRRSVKGKKRSGWTHARTVPLHAACRCIPQLTMMSDTQQQQRKQTETTATDESALLRPPGWNRDSAPMSSSRHTTRLRDYTSLPLLTSVRAGELAVRLPLAVVRAAHQHQAVPCV